MFLPVFARNQRESVNVITYIVSYRKANEKTKHETNIFNSLSSRDVIICCKPFDRLKIVYAQSSDECLIFLGTKGEKRIIQ